MPSSTFCGALPGVWASFHFSPPHPLYVLVDHKTSSGPASFGGHWASGSTQERENCPESELSCVELTSNAHTCLGLHFNNPLFTDPLLHQVICWGRGVRQPLGLQTMWGDVTAGTDIAAEVMQCGQRSHAGSRGVCAARSWEAVACPKGELRQASKRKDT